MMRSKLYLLVGFIVVTAFALPAAAQEGPPCEVEPCETPCEIEPCEPPPDPGGSDPASPPDSPPPAPPWGGLGDGRLNPEPAEYYSVWCLEDVVRVLRAVPPPTVLVDNILLADVVALPESGDGYFVSAGGVSVLRTGDTVTLSGDNGNLAPQPGSKSFSLALCLERNGPLADDSPEEAPPPAPQEEVCDVLTSWFDFLNCLASPGGLGVMMSLANTVCGGNVGLATVLVAPGGYGLLRRRRRQRGR